MNYTVMSSFLMGVVFMTGFMKWDRSFRIYAHLGLMSLAIIVAWIL